MFYVYRLRQSETMLYGHGALEANVQLDHQIAGMSPLLFVVALLHLLAGDPNNLCRVDSAQY